jgi:UDP-N-acetylmuramoylalanine--D-glutamate ligase
VLELSSFQLDGMFDFKAHIGVLMNTSPDHLDRYNYCFQNYVDSKMRITRNQTEEDYFIFSADDKVIEGQRAKHTLTCQLLPFAAQEPHCSAHILGESFKATVAGRSVTIDLNKMQIKGLHNSYDAMAAALAALAAGVDPQQIETSIYNFSPVEHRLEPVAEIDGVLYIYDSKATNVDSVWYALESITRPVVWIAGGTDKGNDYTPLKAFAKSKVHTLVCMGLDNAKLMADFEGIVPTIISTDTLEAAMCAAKGAAQSGDVVLLSPACASFDLFKNYCHRGEMFKEWVNNHK